VTGTPIKIGTSGSGGRGGGGGTASANPAGQVGFAVPVYPS
jgi:hypothetical protein